MSFSARLKRAERRVLVWWIRYAHRHQNSHILPLMLFLLTYLDGFVVVIPSSLCLIASVTISPRRWFWFTILFAVGTASNNATTYLIGRSLSPQTVQQMIEFLNLHYFLEPAREALRKYGPFATFIGALVSLPTQIITALIGMADAQAFRSELQVSSRFLQAILFAFLGHGIKAFAIAALTRYGWLKLEKKFGKQAGESAAQS